jgi:DNA recombination protein RmuC
MTSVQVEVGRVAERINAMDQTHAQVGQGLQAIQSAMQQELAQARLGLTDLQAQAQARVELEYRTAESVRRLEGIIAGTQSKGLARENILEVVFSQLPPEWQLRDFKVKNKTVELALRLPNNLILPIDSKWPATSLIEQFIACDQPAEQQRLKREIEKVVLDKAKELKKYIDPDLTVNFGIAAVPDAVYDLCAGIQCACLEHNVVVIAYSMFIPYMLLVFQTILKSAQHIDADRLDAYIQAAQKSIHAAQEELEGRFARSLTMLGNSRNDLVCRHQPAPPAGRARYGVGARASGLGGARAAVWAAPMGGARLPPGPRYPAALAARLLCLLVLLVGLPPPARHACGRSGARHGPRPGSEAGGGKGRATGDRPTLSWPVALRQVQGWLDRGPCSGGTGVPGRARPRRPLCKRCLTPS